MDKARAMAPAQQGFAENFIVRHYVEPAAGDLRRTKGRGESKKSGVTRPRPTLGRNSARCLTARDGEFRAAQKGFRRAMRSTNSTLTAHRPRAEALAAVGPLREAERSGAGPATLKPRPHLPRKQRSDRLEIPFFAAPPIDNCRGQRPGLFFHTMSLAPELGKPGIVAAGRW